MNYPLLDVFLTMFFFFMWILWLFLVIRIVINIFRSDDLGGWAKAGWLAVVILLPFIGVVIYLIARGNQLTEGHLTEGQGAREAALEDQKFRTYERYMGGR